MVIDYDTLFWFVDDFCKGFEPWYRKQLISGHLARRCREGHLTLFEVLTILIAYHQSGMACFKYFYLDLCHYHHSLLPKIVYYDRFVALIRQAFPALVCLLKSLKKEIVEYLFIDSTPMAVCHNLRERKHKVFEGLAAKGRMLIGWFFGLKLHLIFNTHGEIVRLTITPGNVDDKSPMMDMVKELQQK